MAAMTDPTASPEASPSKSPSPDPPTPGERRLDRPPSDRYREAEAPPDAVAPAAGSPARAIAYALIVGVVGVVAIVVFGGVLAFSAGLLVVAAVLGRATALALRLGGGVSLRPPALTWLAVGLALGAVVVGQLGLWWYALTEGGVLGPLDYLVETYGVLVPLELLLAAAFAWWAAR
jgi:hypothetical protein